MNAIIGDNGIITKAQEAKRLSEESDIKERLELMIVEYVSDVEGKESFQTYLTGRKGKEIDDALQIPDPNGSGARVNAVKVGEQYYVILEENGKYKVEKMNTDMSSIGGGITLATPENFEGGTMDFNPGEGGKSTLVFSDKIEAEYNFNIQSGEVTIYIDNDMTLTNEGLKRSAINIEPGAKLNLHIAEGKTLTVNSGFGEEGETNDGSGANGGPRWVCRNSSTMDR